MTSNNNNNNNRPAWGNQRNNHNNQHHNQNHQNQYPSQRNQPSQPNLPTPIDLASLGSLGSTSAEASTFLNSRSTEAQAKNSEVLKVQAGAVNKPASATNPNAGGAAWGPKSQLSDSELGRCSLRGTNGDGKQR